jgi:HAMP domain-containing protein
VVPILLLVSAGLVVFLAWSAWAAARSSQQPLRSIDNFSRALEAMEPSSRPQGDVDATDGDAD